MTREMVNRKRLKEWMKAVGRAARAPARILLTGGATAVLEGWREQTLDIDISGKIDGLLSDLARLKNEFNINVETAKPTDFVPSLPGERDRHRFIERHGKVEFFHFDPYAQAFSKIERGFPKDLADARRLVAEGLVDMARLRDMVRALSDEAFHRHIHLSRERTERALEEFN